MYEPPPFLPFCLPLLPPPPPPPPVEEAEEAVDPMGELGGGTLRSWVTATTLARAVKLVRALFLLAFGPARLGDGGGGGGKNAGTWIGIENSLSS